MAEALDRAGVPASAVGYVNAHGTGTPQNDRVEAAALRKLFDPDAVLVSANKSLVGHAMAAAGALEAIATVLTLVHELIPPTAQPRRPGPRDRLRLRAQRGAPRRARVRDVELLRVRRAEPEPALPPRRGAAEPGCRPLRPRITARPRVVVTGVGSVSALGVAGGAAVGDALARGVSGIGPVRSFPTGRCWSRLGGEAGDVTPHLQDGEARRLARASQLAVDRGPARPERRGSPGRASWLRWASCWDRTGATSAPRRPSRSGSSSAGSSGSRLSSSRTP